MRLFTPAVHRGLSCDAYVIDADRDAVPLVLDAGAPVEAVIDAVLQRLVLLSRSLHDMRRRTFGLFCARRGAAFVLAHAEPCDAPVLSALDDVLGEFGPVRRGPAERLRDGALTPLVAFVGGRVCFFRSAATRGWEQLAGRRALRIVAPVWSHAPDADVFIDGMPAADYLSAPAEATLDLEAREGTEAAG